jgi:hypothetical protein
MPFRRWLINPGKLVLCSITFSVGIEIGGMVASLVGLQQAPVAPGADRNLLHLYALLSTPLLALALALIARGLGAGFVTRTLILSFLTWIAYAVNDQLEGLLVSTYSAGFWFAAVESLVASLLGGVAVASLFPPEEEGNALGVLLKAFFGRRGIWTWLWRLVIASVAFMPIYFVFGLLALPFVSEYYQQGMYGLKEPAVDQLLAILFVRSVLFLLACLPILIAWRDSTRSLFFSLGFALFVLVGVPSILIAYWLPVGLRLPHALEILADEFMYIGVLIVLLVRGGAPTTRRRRT